MAKPELGTKRVCPETGRKFYDLNRDPIVSPYTGKSYPLSFFEDTSSAKVAEKQEEEEEVAEVEAEGSEADTVSLEEADEEASGGNDKLPDMDDDGDVELDDDDSDTFLESDEDDEDDDMSNLIGGRPEDEDDV